MRKVFWAIAAAGMLAVNTGCLIPMYSADPARRAQELIFTSEDLRNFSTNGNASGSSTSRATLTPMRTHGGII